MNLKIHAAKNNITEIDIFGDIGQSWFSEGNTMGSVRAALKDVEGDLLINVSSLGGDAGEGLAIHDIIKSHKGNVTVKVIGLTASAGTFVALAGNKVEMSENAMFLVHNSWTMAMGNASDLRKTADSLDKFDARQISLYVAKTGKSEDEIKSLMAEEKWIDATEAKDFGFIDSIYTPTSAAASISIDSKKLIKAGMPPIPIKQNPKTETMSTEKEKSTLAKVLALIKGEVESPAADEKDDMIAQLEAAIVEKDAKIVELEAKIAELEGVTETATEEAEQAAAVIVDLNAKLGKAKAVATVVASADPLLVEAKVFVTEGEKILKNILAGTNDIEKSIHAKK